MQLGIELALMGIGTVFIFLVLLIFLMDLMSKIINSYEKRVLLSAPQKKSTNKTDKIPDDLLSVIITNAIKQHQANVSKKG